MQSQNKNKLKVVFFGTPQIARVVLEGLINNPNFDVCLVVSQPDKKVGRKQNVKLSPVKIIAQKFNLKILQPNKVNDIFEEIVKCAPDFLITCAYGQFIPSKILDLVKIEALNVHGSLLPKYRGGAPIQYAIWKGETETGISIMRMVKKMDSGAVFSQKSIKIDFNETSGDLFSKLAIIARELLVETIQKIVNKNLKAVEQNEAQVSFAYNITPQQEKINWNQSAIEIHNQVRAFNPQPIAYSTLNNVRYKFYKTCLLDKNEYFVMPAMVYPNGTIVNINKEGIIIQTATGFLKLLEIQKAGKTVTKAGPFALNNLKVGECFR